MKLNMKFFVLVCQTFDNFCRKLMIDQVTIINNKQKVPINTTSSYSLLNSDFICS